MKQFDTRADTEVKFSPPASHNSKSCDHALHSQIPDNYNIQNLTRHNQSCQLDILYSKSLPLNPSSGTDSFIGSSSTRGDSFESQQFGSSNKNEIMSPFSIYQVRDEHIINLVLMDLIE